MANTYSSWEYSQGPILYIDSSGFESIDANKNFVYYYIVTYGPVEYKRKVTNEKGESTYEYKYSFGTSNADRKMLQRCTFSGKEQMTKTVTHEVTEDGFKKSITKTFIIDTNIKTNIENNQQPTIDPTYIVNTHSWAFNSSITKPDIGKPYIGWVTVTKSGYKTVTKQKKVAVYESVRVDYGTEPCYGKGCFLYDLGINPHRHITWEKYERRFSHYEYQTYTTQEPYNYTEVVNSYCKLNLKTLRDKIKDYSKFSSVTLVFKTKDYMNKAPNIYIDTATTATAKRVKLQPKNSGSTSAGGNLEYYLPMDIIQNSFGNVNETFILIERGSCTAANGYIIEAYALLEIEAESMPYINLAVQAYNKAGDSWNTCCVIPYLNHAEIEEMRTRKQHVSKNLFFPSDLPKTDANYRIQLDTNLAQHDAEKFTNFRIDVLSDQLIPPGSIEDKKLYINNDSLEFEHEVEVDEINEIKLNVLGFSTHQKVPYAGFLKQGANDVHAYLKNAVFIADKDILEENISKNVFYNFVSKTNGNWVSNNVFAANTFDIGAVGILQGNDNLLKDTLIEFKMPYNALKPNSSYAFIFTANVEETFSITNINTVDEADQNKVAKARLFVESNADSSKVNVKESNTIFYTPPYKLKTKTGSENISEYNYCKKNIKIKVEFDTGNIDENDTATFVLKINRFGIKNIIIKNMQCTCVDENNIKHVDVVEPYNVDIYTGRQYDIFMTVYYDGFNLHHINPLLYNDMMYLRSELDKIRAEYTLEPYPWSEWTNGYDSNNNLITDDEGHGLGVEVDQPLRAVHFNDVKKCCVQTYEELLDLKPPVNLNTSPTQMREGINMIPLVEEDPSQGYILQHYKDRLGNMMEIDKYFPEWRQIINLINRN